jgi:tetratricopeptide (TPR) repeat protein
MAQYSTLKCQKCGHLSNVVSDVCLCCGARLEKLCGECGFSNAVEKDACAQCGAKMLLRPGAQEETKICEPDASLAPQMLFDKGQASVPASATAAPLAENQKFQFEMEPIQDTVSDKDASFLRRVPSKSPASGEKSAQPAYAAEAPHGNIPPIRLVRSKALLAALAVAVLVCVLAGVLYFIAAPSLPKLGLKMAANSYLNRLASGKYEEAYKMLSSNSKSACSLKDYVESSRDYYGGVPSWEFGKVEVFAMEPEAAMVSYQLKEGTETWRTEYISFVREHGRWTRPYIRMFFAPIKVAIARQDYSQALFLAQKLYLTDSMDPRSAGYLCSAEFLMGLYDKAAASCNKAVLSAKTYPARFTQEELLRYRIYYADSLRFTQKFELAFGEYDELLKSVSTREQCRLFMGRADTCVRMKRYDTALKDMFKADSVCWGDANRADIARRMRIMNGEARADAITVAQAARFGPNMPSFRELRRKETASGTGTKHARPPKDNWSAERMAGPEYRVVLKEENMNPGSRRKEIKDLYVFMVNLWTGFVKLERGSLPPGNGAD